MPLPNGRPTTAELLAAREARECEAEAQQSWYDRALAGMAAYCRTHAEFIGEDFRIYWGEEPHHTNRWGALVLRAKELGWIRDSGRTVNMRIRSSHGRRSTLWVSNLYQG